LPCAVASAPGMGSTGDCCGGETFASGKTYWTVCTSYNCCCYDGGNLLGQCSDLSPSVPAWARGICLPPFVCCEEFYPSGT
jgi:hypothetical protein